MSAPARIGMDSRPEDIGRIFCVSRESLARLSIYADLLKKWQKRINLIGKGTIDQIWPRHIADGLQMIPHLPDNTKAIVDFGSGAGVPALIIAIATSDKPKPVIPHLIESNAKKCAFLREAARLTGAEVRIHQKRIETIAPESLDPFPQVLTARAFAPLADIMPLAQPYCEKGVICLLHKGQDVDIELTQTTKYWNINPEKYPSMIESGGCIVKVEEIHRAKSP